MKGPETPDRNTGLREGGFPGASGSAAITESCSEAVSRTPRIAPEESARETLRVLGYGCGPEYPDFREKSIIDVGGGFSKLAVLLQKEAARYDIADPLFAKDDVWSGCYEEIDALRRQIRLSEEWLKDPRSNKASVEAAIRRKLAVLSEAEGWLSFQRDFPDNLSFIPCRADELMRMRGYRYDYAFANHVLSKPDCDMEHSLFHIRHVLKGNGILIVMDAERTDFGDFDPRFESALESVWWTVMHREDAAYWRPKIIQFA